MMSQILKSPILLITCMVFLSNLATAKDVQTDEFTPQKLSTEGSIESANWVPDDQGMIVVDGNEVLAEDFYKRIGVANPFPDAMTCPNPDASTIGDKVDTPNSNDPSNGDSNSTPSTVDSGEPSPQTPDVADRPDLRLPTDGTTPSPAHLELLQALPQEAVYYPESLTSAGEQIPSDEDLKALLFEVISKAHIRNTQSALKDQTVDSCPASLGENQKCFEHQSLKYRTARTWLFGQLHLGQNQAGEYYVKDVYCQKDFTAADFSNADEAPGPDKIPLHTVVNTEHTWPQSRFNPSFPKEIQKGDLHHLFPTDSKHNSSRGNFRFGEVTDGTKDMACEGNKYGKVTPPAGLASDGAIFYEPPAVHKGNVARALFYFSIRYQIAITDIEEYYLRKWHREDPIDQFEVERHQMIFEIQGNRNPFIDFPQLVDQISNF